MTLRRFVSKMPVALLSALVGLSLGAEAQETIPQGTTIPVQLDSSISFNSQPGARIVARVMQNVPLPNRRRIHEGAKLEGHVIAVSPHGANGAAQVSFRFDNVISGGRTIPVTTRLNALASFVEIEEAQIPDMGPDRGTPPNAWNTTQIGGDLVYRGGGPVTEGATVVGRPTPHGVLVNAGIATTSPCNDAAETSLPRAVWLFSADACGVYGINGLTIAATEPSQLAGDIVLTSTGQRLSVPSGSGMLLEVVTSGNRKASDQS